MNVSVLAHRHKFGTIPEYCTQLKSTLQSFGSTIVSTSLNRSIFHFQSVLKDLHEIARQCCRDNYSNFLKGESVQTTLKRFIEFWTAAIRILQALDLPTFLDITVLSAAHISDLNFISSLTSSALADRIPEIVKIRQSMEGFLDISQLRVKRYISATPFSLFFGTADNQTLEIFPSSTPALFHRYAASLRALVPHPYLLLFSDISSTLPWAVTHEGSIECSLARKMKTAELDATSRTILLLEIARGIEFLHSLKIVHRNLSPDVIYLTEDQHVKIGGFYIAGSAFNDKARSTPFSVYISPELLIDPNAHDPEIDVYSFAIIFWEFVTGKRAFENCDDSAVRSQILNRDARPALPDDMTAQTFLLRAWGRNPRDRQSFAEIVAQIQSKALVVPGTDLDRFDEWLKSEGTPQQIQLSGILQASINSISAAQRPISDRDLNILARVCSEGGELREQAIDLIRTELSRAEPFSVNGLVALVKVSIAVPEFWETVCGLFKPGTELIEFSKTLVASIAPDDAVRFFVQIGILSDETANVLLEFGSSQTPAIARKIAELVATSRPESNAILENASLHPQYLERALAMLQALPDPLFQRNSEWLVRVTEGIPDQPPPEIENLVKRIDPLQAPLFDEKCVLFARLVLWGFSESVLRFVSNGLFCRRFLNCLLPTLSSAHPVFCLQLGLAAMRFKGVTNILLQYDLLGMILGALNAKAYEIAAQAALRIPFPLDMLNAGNTYADSYAHVLEVVEDSGVRSCVCLTLLPFAMQTNWVPTVKTIQIISQLLQSESTTEVGRAMILAVAIAQKPDIAFRLADTENLEVACRFFNCDAPNHFLYTAVRFFLAIAPFLRLEVDDPTIRESVEALIGLALRSTDQPRLVLVSLQTLVLLPRGDDWNTIVHEAGVGKLFEFVNDRFPNDQAILEVNQMLPGRMRKQSL